jgi:uncharacterized protein (DUF427 family)
MWKFTGRERPDFAVDPAPGQESVWDYPRPPAIERCDRVVEVWQDGNLIARTTSCYRVKETASPPTVYVPAACVDWDLLTPAGGQSYCEWKGAARYWALASDPQRPVAWAYPKPSAEFSVLADQVSFYPSLVECYVDGERVRPQAGGFYGGWVTDDIVGPFKGDPGTGHW